jgi:TolB-like protein
MPIVRPARVGSVKTLAVLPVANYSGDSRHDGFSDGLTEALIAEFAQVEGVNVTSRTSSMNFRDQKGLLPSIARQLGVDLVLEASVVRTDGRIGITAQLIDASTDLHVLARRYEFAEGDVLTLHATVAKAVVRDVRAAGIGAVTNRASNDPAGQ